MFRRLALFFLIAAALSMFFACKPEIPEEPPVPKTPDFRAADWGYSKAEVQKSQLPNEELYADEWTMLYEVAEGGDMLLVYYFFEEDKLVSGECRIEMGDAEWSRRVPEMIESYAVFRNNAIMLYGEPLEDDYRVWLDKDPDYVNDPDMHNLYYKRLEYLTEWQTERSLMSLRLFYKDRDFKFVFEAFEK